MLQKQKIQINDFLKTLKLELHPEKSKVIPLHKGVELLGFRVFYHYKLLKKSNIRQTKKRVENFKRLYTYRYISKRKIAESMQSWCAHANWGNNYKLRRRVVKEVGDFLNGK